MRTILRYLLLCLLLTCFGVGKGQLWEPLGIQLDHQPLVLYADSTSNLLYLGGYFQQVNGISVNGLISYNGTSWDTVGTNFQGYETKSFTRYQGKLWVGGALYLGVLDGQQWSNVTVNGVVNALLNYEGKLIAAGGFDTIAGIPINNLAAFDGQTWSPFHGSDTAIYSPLCIIHTLQEYRGALIVGGNIGQLGAMKEVLQWDGIQWRDLGGGIEGTGFVQVLDLEVFNGELTSRANLQHLQMAKEITLHDGTELNGILLEEV